MEQIHKLRDYYTSNPPRPSYGGTEGRDFKCLAYLKYPEDEASKLLGIGSVVVWRDQIPAFRNDLPIERFCVIDVCLDPSGLTIPKAFPLLPEMNGHECTVVIYVDMLGIIRARAIGGATTYTTRNTSALSRSANAYADF